MQEPVLTALDLDKKNEDGGEYVRLCNRRSVIDRRRRWKMKASSISF